MWNDSTLFIVRYASKASRERVPGCQVLDHSGEWGPTKLAAEVQRRRGLQGPGADAGPLPARFFGTDSPCDSVTVVLATKADPASFAREFFKLLSREPAQRVASPGDAEAGVSVWTTVSSDAVLVLADAVTSDEDALLALVQDLKSDEARFLEGQWHEIFLARSRYLSAIRDHLILLGQEAEARRDELVVNFKESLDTPAADDRASQLCRYLVKALADLSASGHDARQVDFTVETARANMQRFAGALGTPVARSIAEFRIAEAGQLAGMIGRDLALLSAGVNDVRWLLEACETFCQQQESRQQKRRERKLTWLGIWLGASQILLGITAFWPAAVTATVETDYSKEHYWTAMWFLATPSLLIVSGAALLFCTCYWLLKPKMGLASQPPAKVRK